MIGTLRSRGQVLDSLSQVQRPNKLTRISSPIEFRNSSTGQVLRARDCSHQQLIFAPPLHGMETARQQSHGPMLPCFLLPTISGDIGVLLNPHKARGNLPCEQSTREEWYSTSNASFWVLDKEMSACDPALRVGRVLCSCFADNHRCSPHRVESRHVECPNKCAPQADHELNAPILGPPGIGILSHAECQHDGTWQINCIEPHMVKSMQFKRI